LNKDICTFHNDVFNLAVKLENGEWVFDVERVARCLGIIKKEIKNGKPYTSIRWERINEYLGNFRPQLGEIKKGDFIPEPAVYKLAFKASNEVAEKFQDWLAIDVLPQLRQTNEYKIEGKSHSNNEIKKLKLEQTQLEFVMDRMKLSKASEVTMIREFNESQGLSTAYLPDYVDEDAGCSLSTLLKKFEIKVSAIKFNKLLLEKGYLEEKIRKSTNVKGFKKYKSLTDKGLKYGKNATVPKAGEKETQPLYFEKTFEELTNMVLN